MKIGGITKDGYLTREHITYLCNYHVVFCPKYRRKVLTGGIDVRLKDVLLDVAKKYHFEITDMEVMPDHVHLIISCNPRFGIMNAIHKLKGISSKILRDEYHELKKRLPTLWTRGVFVNTVGDVSLETLKVYIENQKNV